jgi:D-methionine transport system ATP-binding protein
VLEHGRVVEEGRVYDVFTSPRAEVTRSFVRDVVDRALPAQLVERMRRGSEAGGRPVLRIVFTGPSAHHPVLAEVVRRFDVLLNIIEGHIAYIQEQPYGNLVVEAIGDDAAIARALAYVRDQQLSVEVIGRVAGDARAVA